jgi:cytochrome c553
MRTIPRIVAAALVAVPLAASAQGTFTYTGRDLAASCAICHGTNGTNAGGLPNLAGQPQDYLARQLRDFRDGKRPATIMHQISKGLTEDQIAAVTAYWSAQKAK